MKTAPPPLPEIDAAFAENFLQDYAAQRQPVVIRGLAADWPLIDAAARGAGAAAEYLDRFDCGLPARVMRADASERGRFFYTPDMRGFNFTSARVPLGILMRELIRIADDNSPPALYAGSNPVDEHLPGFSEANGMTLAPPETPARIWIGNATHIAAHYDASENIAVVASGKRRFTLFPPDQLPNMYVGPLDLTIAGQPVSMVDVRAPDLVRYPRFAKALAVARVGDLEPGDAIYIPRMWWHDVVAEGPFNILVNYWYGQAETGSPFVALLHAMQAVRDLAPPDRAAWRGWFDHYVFADDAAGSARHLPLHIQGVAGPASPERERRIVAYLRQVLFPD